MTFFSLRFFFRSHKHDFDSGLIFNMADVNELAAIFLFHFFLKLYFGQIIVVAGNLNKQGTMEFCFNLVRNYGYFVAYFCISIFHFPGFQKLN